MNAEPPAIRYPDLDTAAEHMPVRAVLRQRRTPVDV